MLLLKNIHNEHNKITIYSAFFEQKKMFNKFATLLAFPREAERKQEEKNPSTIT